MLRSFILFHVVYFHSVAIQCGTNKCWHTKGLTKQITTLKFACAHICTEEWIKSRQRNSWKKRSEYKPRNKIGPRQINFRHRKKMRWRFRFWCVDLCRKNCCLKRALTPDRSCRAEKMLDLHASEPNIYASEMCVVLVAKPAEFIDAWSLLLIFFFGASFLVLLRLRDSMARCHCCNICCCQRNWIHWQPRYIHTHKPNQNERIFDEPTKKKIQRILSLKSIFIRCTLGLCAHCTTFLEAINLANFEIRCSALSFLFISLGL